MIDLCRQRELEPPSSNAGMKHRWLWPSGLFGLDQDILTAVMRYLAPTMRSFDRSRWTFGISRQLPTRLLMLTAR